MKLLVIGSGGREHALVWKLAQSLHASAIWCAPGNAGIAQEPLARDGTPVECIPAGAEDLPRLPYTEKVVKEAMRLYPPAYVILRLALEPLEIGGYELPAGSSVGISPWVTHHDARYFPEPEKFAPERWTDAFMQKLPRFAYIPFGGGPRICIGAQFAMMEAVLVLATVARKFEIRPAVSEKPELFPSITLRPKNGIRATVVPRAAAANSLSA